MNIPRDEQRKKARKFLRSFSTRNDWVVVDTETTGPDPEEDDLVEITILTAEGTVLLDTLVSPYNDISDGARDVHGIAPEDVEQAPTMDDLRVVDLVFRKFPVLIYNADFDGRIIENGFAYRDAFVDRANWDLRCVMEAYAMAHGEWDEHHGSYSWVKLEQACEERGVSFEGTTLHRAKGDAELTRRLVRTFQKDAEEMGQPTA